MNAALAINRTPDLIAVEINSIKSQTQIMVLCNSIEIGKKLVEAKSLLPHGEWGNWLETSVDYSQRTANNLMKVFEEYGSKQMSLFGEAANSQALANLSYTQAVALICLPENERENFVEEHNLDGMSTRELQKALKELDQSRKDKEEAEQKLKDANRIADEKDGEARRLQEELEQAQKDSEGKIQTLQCSIENMQKELETAKTAGNEKEVERLKLELEEADNQLLSANDEIADLNRQLQEKPIDVQATTTVESIPEEVQKELDELRRLRDTKQQSLAIPIFEVHFKQLVDDFRSLLGTLAQIESESEPKVADKYKHATLELISQMSARV